MSFRRGSMGFTLLEVMVSMAILAMALTAIAGINANSFEESNYARFITVGTLLARSKMIDVEEELRKDGFSESDKEYSGDFADEGYPSLSWSATARKVEIDLNQMISGLFGGEVTSESLPEDIQGMLSAFQGGGAEGASEQVEGSELSKMLGGGGLEAILKPVGDNLANSIREITLEITWGKKGQEESVKFVQYVTTTGRLAQQNQALGAPGTNPGDRNADTSAVGAAGGVPGQGAAGVKPTGLPNIPGLNIPGLGGSKP